MNDDPAAKFLFTQMMASLLAPRNNWPTALGPVPDPVFDPDGHATYQKRVKEAKRPQAETIAKHNLLFCPSVPLEEEALSPVPKTLPTLPLHALTPRQATEHDRIKRLYLAYNSRLFRVELEKYDMDPTGRREAMFKFGDEVLCTMFGADWLDNTSTVYGGKATPSAIYDDNGGRYGGSYTPASGCTCCPHGYPIPSNSSQSSESSTPPGISKASKKEKKNPLARHVAAAFDKADARRNGDQKEGGDKSKEVKKGKAEKEDEDDMHSRDDYLVDESTARRFAMVVDGIVSGRIDPFDKKFIEYLEDPYGDAFDDDYFDYDPSDEYDSCYGNGGVGYYDGYEEAMFDALYVKARGEDSAVSSTVGLESLPEADKGKKKKKNKKKAKKGNQDAANGSTAAVSSEAKGQAHDARTTLKKATSAFAKPAVAKNGPSASNSTATQHTTTTQGASPSAPEITAEAVEKIVKRINETTPRSSNIKAPTTSVASVGLGQRKKTGNSSSNESSSVDKANVAASNGSKFESKPARKRPSPTEKPTAATNSSVPDSSTKQPTSSVKHPNAATKGSSVQPMKPGAAKSKQDGVRYEMVIFKKPYKPTQRPERDCWHWRGTV
ncbi:uncharacterized protein MEPE_02230 [Melanopsichium pennsylvanicum]|uniref:Uncharacterized protein n=2 Tax=Melanopsichium pennsylvanicum TaxID=63383 RepID=A0AAJ4XK04_9BASI|nr:uncharacterized protein BN887_05018 [Melanopsichium pennsylvanicum 4]SNX83523.1 uncharacterized protein MEPE_02230 [Melanopsichium pennsylvanicum]